MKTVEPKSKRSPLFSIFFTIFLDVLGVGILIPVIPQLLTNPSSPDFMLPAGYSPTDGLILLGWLTAIYPLMQFFATPILGQLSDRFGRKKVLAISLAGTAFGYILFAIGIYTRNLPLLFLARGLDGLTGGNIAVAQAVIADVSTPKNRTKNFALIGATFGIGFVFGPYIGSKLASGGVDFYGLFSTPEWFNPATPFWFAAVLSAFNVALIMLTLAETHPMIDKMKSLDIKKSLSNIVTAATAPGLRTIFPSIFLYFGGFTFFTTFFQVFLAQKLKFSVSNIGDFFAYIGLLIAFTQAVITPFVAKRLNSLQIVRFSMIMTGIGLMMLLLASNTTLLLLFTPIFAMFNGLTVANTLSLVSASAEPNIQGEVLGINASVQALAQAIPAVLSGYVASLAINLPVFVGGSIMIFAGLLFIVLYRPVRPLGTAASMSVSH